MRISEMNDPCSLTFCDCWQTKGQIMAFTLDKDFIVYTMSIFLMLLFMIPSVLTIMGILFHEKENNKGSDYPHYLSIWRCFICIADLFTDILVCLLLYIYKSDLLLFAIGFIALSFLCSSIATIYHICAWKRRHISKSVVSYYKRYSQLVIILSLCSYVHIYNFIVHLSHCRQHKQLASTQQSLY